MCVDENWGFMRVVLSMVDLFLSVFPVFYPTCEEYYDEINGIDQRIEGRVFMAA